METKVMQKLKQTKGESISEVLIASLVLVFGFLLFVTMVQASMKMMKKSEDAYNDYVEVSNQLEAFVDPKPDGKLVFYVNAGTPSSREQEVDVKYIWNKKYKIGTYVYEKK